MKPAVVLTKKDVTRLMAAIARLSEIADELAGKPRAVKTRTTKAAVATGGGPEAA